MNLHVRKDADRTVFKLALARSVDPSVGVELSSVRSPDSRVSVNNLSTKKMRGKIPLPVVRRYISRDPHSFRNRKLSDDFSIGQSDRFRQRQNLVFERNTIV